MVGMAKKEKEFDINIRKYIEGDRNEVIRLISDVLVNEFKFILDFDKLDSDLAQIEYHYNVTGGGCFWVSELSEKRGVDKRENKKRIVGTTAIRKLDQFDPEMTAELKRMYVSKEYRGLGIGQRMLNRAIDFAKKFGYSRILLDSSHSLIPAGRLYFKNGFIYTSRYNDNYRADV